ncbi:HSP70-domain-containing protein [Xylaria arbuscula]|nr:HSP70-domain-containing protein [Xylaria arbuscula]
MRYSGSREVAYGRNRSDIHVVPGGDNEKSIPSCVAFTEAGPLIGTAARLWGIENPETKICNPQALLGRNWSDPDVQTFIKDLPYEVLSGYRDNPVFKIDVGHKGKIYTPEEVTSLIIGELKSMAEVAMGGNETVMHAVIAVPRYYTDQQRQGIRDAARLAGVEVFRVLSEPRAASLAYGLGTRYDSERNIVVVDIGDTLDVSIWNVEEEYFDELAISHHDIGGKLFSRRVIDYLVEFWRERTGQGLADSPSHLRKLNLEVERVKIALSSREMAEVDLRSVNPAFIATLSRSRFEEIIENSMTAIVEAIRQTLNEAKLDFTEIDDVILTGGSGYIPKIGEKLAQEFPNKTIHKDLGVEATVVGAAQHAAFWSEPQDTNCGLYFLDSDPLDFGIETADGTMATIVPRSALPVIGSMNFSTAIDGQSNMLIRVLQGQRVLAADNLVIGELELPLAPAPAGIPRVGVTFKVLALREVRDMTKVETDTNNSVKITISPDKGMWIGENYEYREGVFASQDFLGNWPEWEDADPELRAQVDAYVDLESYLTALQVKFTDSDDWNVDNGVKRNVLGHPIMLSELLRDIVGVRRDLELYRGTWDLKTLQELKEAFTYLSKPFVGELDYKVIRKVGGDR